MVINAYTKFLQENSVLFITAFLNVRASNSFEWIAKRIISFTRYFHFKTVCKKKFLIKNEIKHFFVNNFSRQTQVLVLHFGILNL